jgi:sugar lactone lactonase YvrE
MLAASRFHLRDTPPFVKEDVVKTYKHKCGCVPAWVLLLMLLNVGHGHAQVKVTTVAGGFINDGKPATSSALQSPEGGRMDSAGNLYIADQFDHRLRKVSTTGVITTIAGTGIAGYSGDGGPAISAKISFPIDVAIDSAGNILFSDSGNNRIRRISTTGIITTIAGTGAPGFSGDGGPATSAKLNQPYGLNLDSTGDLYFADHLNQRIRKIDTAGIVHTVAGNGTAGFSGDGGLATSAELNFPDDVLPDNSGNFYITDHLNRRVRKVNSSGVISTFAGNGGGGCKGDGGPATSASFGKPTGLLIYSGSLVGGVPTLLVGNACQARIRGVNLSTNVINTFVGSVKGFDGNGKTALSSQFLIPAGVMVDKSGDLLIGDGGNDEVRKVNASTKVVNAFAGGYLGNGGAGTSASLNGPENIAFDKSGNLYIAEVNGNRIRKVSITGVITTFAGKGTSGYSGDGGKATSAQLWFPYGVTADSAGNVFIADSSNNVIRKVNTAGTITTFAKDPSFVLLTGLTTDSGGNVYAADFGACVVWHITPAGAISVFAGVLNSCGFNSDGIAATSAFLNTPYGVAVDSSGSLYIGDSTNNRVRKVTSGIISTYAGTGICGFSGDGGAAKSAKVCFPRGVAVDSSLTVYIGDYANFRVRRVSSSGTISTYAGTGGICVGGQCSPKGYNGDGLVATNTNLDGPISIAVDLSGVAYVADDVQYRVRKIQ